VARTKLDEGQIGIKNHGHPLDITSLGFDQLPPDGCNLCYMVSLGLG